MRKINIDKTPRVCVTVPKEMFTELFKIFEAEVPGFYETPIDCKEVVFRAEVEDED